MINLENRKLIIERGLCDLANYGFDLIDSSITLHNDSDKSEDKITVVFESSKRLLKAQYFTKLNLLIEKRKTFPNFQLSDNFYEYTLFDIKAKDKNDYPDLNINNFIRLTNNKIYFQKFNTYNQKNQLGFTDQEYSVVIKNYNDLLDDKLSNIIKGDDWISTFFDRLDGWTIMKNGKTLKTDK